MSSDPPAPGPDDAVDSTEGLAWTSLDPRDSGLRPIVLPIVAEAPAPQRIGPFELGEELGRGAFGTVFRARRHTQQHDVAIKIFNSRLTTEEANQRFRREVAIAAQLNHPHISSIIDTGMHEGSPYIVMRLIRGPTLHDTIEAEGPFPPDEAARIMALAARAIAHAHARAVIHRDLKPSNILLQDGEPIIVDLGLSKSLIADDTFTTKGDLLGSPLFMAPEQLLGEEADPRSDVFALGGLLFYLLSGQTPRSLEEFRARRTPRLSLPQDTPKTLAGICRRALHPRPEQRFPSAQILAQALEDWRAGRPVNLAANAISSRFFALLPIIALAAGLSLALALDQPARVMSSDDSAAIPIAGGRLRLRGAEADRERPLTLSAELDGVPLWSPPTDAIPDRDTYVLARRGQTMILADKTARQWRIWQAPLADQSRSLELTLDDHPGDLKTKISVLAGARLSLSGVLETEDPRGLVWSRKPGRQLIVRIDERPTWSPPRPADRTLFGREYPIGSKDGTYFGATFLGKDENGGLRVRLIAIPPAP